jgi:hypothetical protein
MYRIIEHAYTGFYLCSVIQYTNRNLNVDPECRSKPSPQASRVDSVAFYIKKLKTQKIRKATNLDVPIAP